MGPDLHHFVTVNTIDSIIERAGHDSASYTLSSQIWNCQNKIQSASNSNGTDRLKLHLYSVKPSAAIQLHREGPTEVKGELGS